MSEGSGAGMGEVVMSSGHHYFIKKKKRFLQPVLSLMSLGWGVLSRCPLTLIQISHTAFQTSPFLYPLKAGKRIQGPL